MVRFIDQPDPTLTKNERDDLIIPIDVEDLPKQVILDIAGEPISGSQLKFNRNTGNAYRPTIHKQRVFTIYEYAKNKLEEDGLERPFFKKGTPVSLSVEFQFPYRSSDYRTGKYSGQLKPNAPIYCIGNKDIDNLLKPLKDGLQGVVFVNDAQIVQYGNIIKRYSETPSTIIIVREV